MEQIEILRLGVFGAVVALSLPALLLLQWLRERDFHPLRSIVRRIPVRRVGDVLIVVCVTFGAARYAVTKESGNSGGEPSAPLRSMPYAPTVEPTAVDSTGMNFPPNFPVVTNLCFWGIERGSNAVSLGIAWPPPMSFTNGLVDLYGNWRLSSNGWSRIAQVDVSVAQSNAVVALPFSDFPTNAMEDAAFFRLASQDDADGDGLPDAYESWASGTDPAVPDTDGDELVDGDEVDIGTDPHSADTDGDGLSDGDETGYVAKADGFEWYDTTGWTTSYSWGYWGSEPGVSSWWCTMVFSSGLAGHWLCGRQIVSMSGFETGYVSFAEPGRGMAWVCPAGPASLSGNVMNTGNFVVAPYWSGTLLCEGDQDSFIRHGTASNGAFVVEFHDVRKSIWSPLGMTYQVILPPGTGNVVRVSYLSSDWWLDGDGAVVGVQATDVQTTNGYYNLTWNFSERGPILPQTTVEFHIGTGTNPFHSDSDFDGLSDDAELQLGTDPLCADTDGDGLLDGAEVAAGTDPLDEDTDGDGLKDGWEAGNGLDPLSSLGGDGSSGDPDGDGLDNAAECRLGTNPLYADTDGDGLSDGEEVVCFSLADPLPWFDAVETTNLTEALLASGTGATTCVLPAPLVFQGAAVDNVSVSRYGTLFFNGPGYVNPEMSFGFDWLGGGVVDSNCFTVAAYAGAINMSVGDAPSSVRIGVAERDGAGYVVFDYTGMRHGTNTVSFQADFPTGDVGRVHVRYSGGFTGVADGGSALVGLQTFRGRDCVSYCRCNSGKMYDGLGLTFFVGSGTDPTNADTDGDGLSDGDEFDEGTDPFVADTDRDGLPDGLEVAIGTNPFQPDSDGDGILDGEEVNVLGTNPSSADTDGDGFPDGEELMNGTDPTSYNAGAGMSSSYPYRGLNFDIDGDYAAWSMTIEGLGPIDYQSETFSMESPGYASGKLKVLRKGNSYRLSMGWLNSSGHENPYWYCWQAKINWLPTTPSYQSYTSTRLEGNEIVHGTGWMAENASGLLTSHVHTHDGAGGNIAGSLQSVLHVYQYDVSICDPDDDAWGELDASRVLLDDECLRIRVRISPAIPTLDLCRIVMGSNICVKTSGTCPAGAEIPIEAADFLVYFDHSEIRMTRTRQQLMSFGLLPQNDDDGVDEMAVYDVGDDNLSSESNLSDSRAFEGIGYQFRGQILKPTIGNLNSTPPVSSNTESFYKAAGCEIVIAHYGGIDSKRRQIMNQADYLYYSGHGRHSDGSLMGLPGGPRLTPELVSASWNRDLKCVIFAGCSVLDINDYNGKYAGTAEHTSSPGKLWANIEGPTSFLGYAYKAPRDTQGADRIASAWVANRGSMGDVAAWMNANDNRNGRNACAIDSSRNFHYFKKSFWKTYNRKIVPKEDL